MIILPGEQKKGEHILSLLSYESWTASSSLRGILNCNTVQFSQVITKLYHKGLVESRPGPGNNKQWRKIANAASTEK